MPKSTAIRKIDQKYNRRVSSIYSSASYAQTLNSSHTADTTIHFVKSDIDLNDLGDVSAPGTPSAGEVLRADGAASWVGTALNLGDLGDVSLPGTPGSGQVLTADGSLGWAAAAASVGNIINQAMSGDVHKFMVWEGTAIGTAGLTVVNGVQGGATFLAITSWYGGLGAGLDVGTVGFLSNDWDGGSDNRFTLAVYSGIGTVQLVLDDHSGGTNPDRLWVDVNGTAAISNVMMVLLYD